MTQPPVLFCHSRQYHLNASVQSKIIRTQCDRNSSASSSVTGTTKCAEDGGVSIMSFPNIVCNVEYVSEEEDIHRLRVRGASYNKYLVLIFGNRSTMGRLG